MPWDQRKVYLPHEPAYTALIARSNGRSAALMLVTYNPDFGERTVIDSVTARCQEDRNDELGSEDAGGEEASWDLHLLCTYGKDYDIDDGNDKDEDWAGSIISFESTATANLTVRHRFIM
jgi:hypothetical protein